MNDKRSCLAAWSLSAIGAMLGGTLLAPRDWETLGASSRILWCGAFFLAVFVGGFLGLSLWMGLDRTYKVRRPRGWFAAFLLSAALLFASGAGGQALFMYTKEEVAVSGAVDMVLLLDASGSMDMSGYSAPRTQAACQFVDSLSSDCRVQAMSFASIVLDRSPLCDMDVGGKSVVTDLIQSIDSVGTTDFNAPLREALDTLDREGRDGCHHAVLLLTDGEGDLSDQVVRDYQDSGVKVSTIRIGTSASGSQARALADFAAATGGFDILLVPDSNGGVEASELLSAFQSAFQAASQTHIAMSDDVLVQGGPISAYQFTVRSIVLMLCSVLFGLGYFGRIQWPALGLDLACGLLLGVILCLVGPLEHMSCIHILCILMGPALVRLDREGSEVIHV